MIYDTTTDCLYSYCTDYSEPHSPLLAELYRETHQKTLRPRMASGPLQGRILSLISKLVQPRHIVEIGTFTGYATLCLAEGLHAEGQILTMEVDPELRFLSDKYFERSPYAHQIEALTGNALDLLTEVADGVDLVFIDAKKRDYIRYYEAIIDKVRPGGILLADNILWDSKVLAKNKDKTTQAIHDFNAHVHADTRVANVILPLRDGVNILQKR